MSDKYYNQYYCAWTEQKGGADVTASSAPANNSIIDAVARSAEGNINSYDKPTYMLSYIKNLKGFVFMCARPSRDLSAQKRKSCFCHVYQLVGGNGGDISADIMPAAFAKGEPQDMETSALAQVRLTGDYHYTPPAVSRELTAKIMYELYFNLPGGSSELLITCENETLWEQRFRDLTVFLYRLASTAFDKELFKVGMSASCFSKNCRINIVTDNAANLNEKKSGTFEMRFSSDGRLTEKGSKEGYHALRFAVCQYLAGLYQTCQNRPQFFDGKAAKLVQAYEKYKNAGVYHYWLNEEAVDVSKISSFQLLSGFEASNDWPYPPEDYTDLLMRLCQCYVFDKKEPNNRKDVINRIYDMNFPEGCLKKDVFCAKLLESIYRQGGANGAEKAKAIFAEEHRQHPSRAGSIAEHIGTKDILIELPEEFSVKEFTALCGDKAVRVFDEDNRDRVIDTFAAAVTDSSIPCDAVNDAVQQLKEGCSAWYDILRAKTDAAVEEQWEQFDFTQSDAAKDILRFCRLLSGTFALRNREQLWAAAVSIYRQTDKASNELLKALCSGLGLPEERYKREKKRIGLQKCLPALQNAVDTIFNDRKGSVVKEMVTGMAPKLKQAEYEVYEKQDSALYRQTVQYMFDKLNCNTVCTVYHNDLADVLYGPNAINNARLTACIFDDLKRRCCEWQVSHGTQDEKRLLEYYWYNYTAVKAHQEPSVLDNILVISPFKTLRLLFTDNIMAEIKTLRPAEMLKILGIPGPHIKEAPLPKKSRTGDLAALGARVILSGHIQGGDDTSDAYALITAALLMNCQKRNFACKNIKICYNEARKRYMHADKDDTGENKITFQDFLSQEAQALIPHLGLDKDDDWNTKNVAKPLVHSINKAFATLEEHIPNDSADVMEILAELEENAQKQQQAETQSQDNDEPRGQQQTAAAEEKSEKFRQKLYDSCNNTAVRRLLTVLLLLLPTAGALLSGLLFKEPGRRFHLLGALLFTELYALIMLIAAVIKDKGKIRVSQWPDSLKYSLTASLTLLVFILFLWIIGY